MNRLQQCKQEEKHDAQSREACIKVLEKMLFERASNSEEHAEIESLDERLDSLRAALVERCLRRAAPAHHDGPSDTGRRNKACSLELLVGSEKYQKIHTMIQEIQLARITGAVGSIDDGAKFHCCKITGSCSAAVRFPTMPKQERVPLAARNLFFRTRLLQAVKMHQASRSARSPAPAVNHPQQTGCAAADDDAVNWDDLLDEASRHLREYQAWCTKQPYSVAKCA